MTGGRCENRQKGNENVYQERRHRVGRRLQVRPHVPALVRILRAKGKAQEVPDAHRRHVGNRGPRRRDGRALRKRADRRVRGHGRIRKAPDRVPRIQGNKGGAYVALLSAKVAKANDKPVKTDAIDCSTIAEVYYTKDKVRGMNISVKAMDPSDLSRQLRERTKEAQSAKCRFRKTIDLVWPLWDGVFKDVYAAGPWAIVRNTSTPLSCCPKERRPS